MKYQRPDGIYLQMMTEKIAETVHLGECAMPLDQLFQGGILEPLLKNVRVDFICGTPVAELAWGRLLYAIENIANAKAIQMTLPGRINISRDMARELRNNRATHMTRLVRCTGGLASVVPLSMPMISSCGWSTIGGDKMKEQEIPGLKPIRKSHHKSAKSGSHPRKSRHREQENRELTLTKVIEESSELLENDTYENVGGEEYGVLEAAEMTD